MISCFSSPAGFINNPTRSKLSDDVTFEKLLFLKGNKL